MPLNDYKLKTIKEFSHATIAEVEEKPGTIVVTATENYIPMRAFQPIFDFIDELAEQKKIEKVIFDKTQLTVFHQPSMEWYFIDWKERMYNKGCVTHRKVLPEDQVFVQSVQIAREKIEKEYPEKKFNQMDIQYADSIAEAIEK